MALATTIRIKFEPVCEMTLNIKILSEIWRSGILFPKLFWSIVSKNCSGDGYLLLLLKAEGWDFAKNLRSLKVLLCKNVLNDVRTALFSVSFSQLPAVKKDTKNGAVLTSLRTFLISSTFRTIYLQRVIRREPKVDCYVLTKVKSPPFVRSFYDNF